MLWHSIGANRHVERQHDAMQVGALAVSGFVTIAKEALFRYLRAEGQRTGSAILLASAWHARMDAVSALVATLGVAGSMAGMPMLDHVAGAAIGLMIMRMGCVGARSALKQLFSRRSGQSTAATAGSRPNSSGCLSRTRARASTSS